MIPAHGSIYDLTLDNRWTCGVFTYQDDNGATVRYELPFLGWGTRVTQSVARDGTLPAETDIVPVFLTEHGRPTALPDLLYVDRPGTTYAGLVLHPAPAPDGHECTAEADRQAHLTAIGATA